MKLSEIKCQLLSVTLTWSNSLSSLVLEISATQEFLIVDGIELLARLKLSAALEAGETFNVEHADRIGRFENHVVWSDVFFTGPARTCLAPIGGERVLRSGGAGSIVIFFNSCSNISR